MQGLWSNATIFKTILPGSHKSGSYFTSDSDAEYWRDKFSSAADPAITNAATLLGDSSLYWDELTSWTRTQNYRISAQITQGIRWFDLRFEYHNQNPDQGSNDWYAHNTIFGPSLSEIMQDFGTYKDQNELIVLQFSSFLPTGVATDGAFSTNWLDFWSTVLTALTTDKIVPSTNADYLKETLFPTMQAQYSYLIIVEDRANVPSATQQYVWDLNDLVTGTEPTSTLGGVMRDQNKDMLAQGWENDKLQRVFWTLEVNSAKIADAMMYGTTTIDTVTISNLEELNRRVIFSLQESIDNNALGTSQWGNALIADFVGKSDLVDVTLMLNYNYLTCYDDFKGLASDLQSCAYAGVNGECNSRSDDCARTCGQCASLPGTLYDACATDSDCISLGSSSTGRCQIMENFYDIVTQPAKPKFCKAHNPFENCDKYQEYYDSLTGYDCSAAGSTLEEQDAYWRTEFDRYCYYCASDAQCDSGVCNKEFQICIVPQLRANLTSPELDTSDRDAYVQFESDDCESFRNRIAWTRFIGEPDIDFDFESINKAFEKAQSGEIMALIDDPYLGSIFCFSVFPLLVGVFMFFGLCCTPSCYCCAKATGRLEKFERYCCCFKKDQQFSKGQILVPFILLGTYSVLILLFCANAIVMNGEISDNILEKGGVIDLMNNTMTYATDFMEGVLIPTNALVDGLNDAFDRAQILVDSTAQTDALILDVTTNMDDLHDRWTVETLDVEVGSKTYVCSGCTLIIASLPSLRSDLNTYAVSASQDLYDVVGDIQTDVLDDEDEIMVDVLNYQQQVQNANDQTVTMRTNVLDTMDLIESVEDNRSVVFAIFFMIPMFLLVFGCCAYCQAADLGRKLYRVNYCLAFILSTVTWILYSFFNITVIIWADTCVRLDVMETNITGSELLDQVYSSDTVKKVMDACINGKHLPTQFNLTATIGFQDLENEIVTQLTVDLVDSFDIPTVNTFRDFVTTLDPTSYYFTVNLMIEDYNSEYNLGLTRTDLQDSTHSPTAGSTAAFAFIQDYYNTEQVQMNTGFTTRVTDFKQDANQLLIAYERLRDYAINDLQGNLTDIKCSLNPVFEQADILLYGNDTAWCGEVGIIYGDMKDKSCVDLFNNFEHTNRSLLVVAIFSMFIGFLSVALGRRISRQFNLFNKKAWNFGDIVE